MRRHHGAIGKRRAQQAGRRAGNLGLEPAERSTGDTDHGNTDHGNTDGGNADSRNTDPGAADYPGSWWAKAG